MRASHNMINEYNPIKVARDLIKKNRQRIYELCIYPSAQLKKGARVAL